MDWKYILSMAQTAEDLEEGKKDELLNTIAWYDFSEEKLDFKKYAALLKLCQEIMKHKSEQVDALLAELDEIAMKQAATEAKVQESDDRSSRSKKSLDSDEQDMKYRDLKSKYRKLQKQIESNKEENDKLKKNIKMLEQERVYLQKEIRSAHSRDDSASDISECVKDQQRNLMESVQQKNTQISQLLTDIENVESDNLQMRARLSSLRDELTSGTEKIETLMDDNKLFKVRLDETAEDYEKLKLENASLRGQMEDFVDDMEARENEFELFAKEIDVRIEEWKNVLDAKNKEIDQLKSKSNQTPDTRASSSSSSFIPTDVTQLNVLQNELAEREENILRLQKQLETATKEMVTTTQVLKQVTNERDTCDRKCDKMNSMIKELKKQIKAAHLRCQILIEDVKYQEDLLRTKDNDIDEVIQKIDNPNLKKLLKELEQAKSEKRSKEKKVADLVKCCNQLRTASEKYEKENTSLRDRLGLTEDDFISTKFVNIQQKRQKKQVDDLKLKLETSEEEKLQYRLELQKLSKVVSNLSDQLIDLGENPILDGQEIDISNLRSKEKSKLDAQTRQATKAEYDTLLGENDALRKGLHEILESVHSKQETSLKEIRSETLESLLRALDAKHVSGWYHPAMRLQAEVHTLQGSNTTLREQLRLAREDLENHKEKAYQLSTIDNTLNLDSSNGAAIANLNNHLINVLKDYRVDDENNVKLVEKLENYKKEFLLVQEQVGVLYNQYTDEKTRWENTLETSEEKLKKLSDSNESLECQLNTIKLFTDPQTNDERKIKSAAEMSSKLATLNRKLVYMENDEKRYKNEMNKLKNQLLYETHECCTKVNRFKEQNMALSLQVERFESTEKFIFPEDVVRLQNDYDHLLIKQRELQRTVDEVSHVSKDELEMLHKKVELLLAEKEELARKLVNTKGSDDNALEKRLAQSEINETTERQRANHTNSLYELVKEQLAKSEERHKEFQKYNNELMQKNLQLQESVKALEDKLLNYVDMEVHEGLKLEQEKLASECHQQTVEAHRLREELNALRKDMATRALWTHMDQYEFHSLKHQIVDLQATGDDKAVIARLSSDVVMARMTEAEIRKKLDEMVAELATCMNDNDVKTAGLSKDNAKCKLTIEASRRRIGNLETIIKQQRNHFLGYVPYTSQEKVIAKISEIVAEGKKIHEMFARTQQIEHDCALVKETLETKTDVLNELNQMIRDGDEQAKALEKWFLDKTNVQLQELRCRRQAEFKETQLKYATTRLQEQEEQIAQLEGELLQSLCLREPKTNEVITKETKLRTTQANVIEIAPVTSTTETPTLSINIETNKVEKANANTQTQTIPSPSPLILADSKADCKTTLNMLEIELQRKNEEIASCKQKVLELEMSISLLRQQMGDKQSQITFYEKHIVEMQQNKKETQEVDRINQLQQTIEEKERLLFDLQSLLKKDRDEHSLAAARFQDELKQLQSKLILQEQVESKKGRPARAAVEYYIQQVHALEKLTTELQTTVSTLNSQLQSSREECVRWRTLASDRLQSVDELRIQLEEQHKNELQAYKSECEKWRNEVSTLQAYINSYKKDILDLRPNIEKELKDKDNKIHELLITLRQLKTELRRKTNTQASPARTEDNFEEIKENLLKEQEVLKKRCEQLINREKSAREEIHSLKGQLIKRPALSARSDSAPSKEQQQTKRIQTLEREVDELKEKLEREVVLNEAHKCKVNVDFDKWNKQKHWQQTAERTKSKLKEKTDECDKLQQTCSSYRMLIERLEREKHNLEVRVKNLKGNFVGGGRDAYFASDASARCEAMEAANGKLLAEISTLKARLEQQQHHSGALSSAMLQDKLEAQERKIAVLEMSAKGGGEMRSEMERVQNTNANLQKCNLRLEAEALDLRLDLEKSAGELPHLREQINYLESYIEVLKSERADEQQELTNAGGGDHLPPESKRVPELERTVFVLKRIVEKLQVENKRLGGGSSRACSSDRSGSADRIRRECNRLKEQFGEKIAALEAELKAANEKLKGRDAREGTVGGGRELMAVREELDLVKGQLRHKAELLDKVKVLLQRAAVKEKALLEQVSSLKAMIDMN